MTGEAPTSLSQALSRAAQPLGTEPAVTAEEALRILDDVPGQQQALLLLVSAFRICRELETARAVLESIAESKPKLAAIQYELGLVLASLGAHEAAAERLSRVVQLEPNHPAAWRVLAEQRERTGDRAGAAEAFSRHVRSSVRELKLLEDAASGSEEDVARAEKMLRQSVALNPTDIMSVRMLAQRELWLGHFHAASQLLENALRLVPGLVAMRCEYVIALQHELKWREAIEQLEIALAGEPESPILESLKAGNLIMLGEFDKAFAIFDAVHPRLQDDIGHWVNYGHALRTVGRSDDALAAYKKVLELEPGFGMTWWSLANLKTYRFSRGEIDTMRAQLDRAEQSDENRCHLEFALGTALEAEGEFAESFAHYTRANTLRRPRLNHDPEELPRRLTKIASVFTPEFFCCREGYGCRASDPIFIVGMPRAGSTLIEQILSSHSAVEGTAELPDLVTIVAEIDRLGGGGTAGYPEILTTMTSNDCSARGEQYLASTRGQRKLDRPFFTDKAPHNFQYVGLIQLILPNAKIIDARRHPMACCFSGFKQCFQMGSMPHTYDLDEVGRYYRNYVQMMAYWDRVLPGRVHRVHHESLVRDPETEIRRLLDYCRLPFEESCLRFHETKRGVRTVSSEQVRRPIYVPEVEPWKNYEAWLEPLKEALGDVLDPYPAVPEFPDSPVEPVAVARPG